MAKKEPVAPAETPSFEKNLDQLEGVVKQLEGADLPLEKALELFEKGVRLSDECKKQLTEAETRVEVLLKKGGKVEPAPFGDDEEENAF
jgi:exodeoxyribonuclease VII small subunit